MVDKANDIWRDYAVTGTPASGRQKPQKSKIREWGTWLEGEIEGPKTVKPTIRFSLCMDSWGIDDAGNSLADELQALYDARVGAAYPVKVLAAAIGGTPVATKSNQSHPSLAQRGPAINSGSDIVLYGTGLNDLGLDNDVPSLGGTLAALQAAYAALKADCDAKGVGFAVCTIPPFKDGPFYNTTTRSIADSLRTWLLATYPGRVVDLWALFNDPANDGAILPAYDDGSHFHVNAAGKARIAQAIVNGIAGLSPIALPTTLASREVRSLGPVVLQQSTTIDSTPHYQGAILGTNDGKVAVLNLRASNLLSPEYLIWMAQPNTPLAGFFTNVGTDGKYTVARYAHPTYTVMLQIDGTPGGMSFLNTGLHAARDGLAQRLSTASYGGGVGAAFETTVTTSSITQGALGTGGNSYIDLVQLCAALTVCGNSQNLNRGRINFNSAGTASLTFDTAGLVTSSAVGYFVPAINGGIAIGAEGNRVGQISATVGINVASDATLKKDMGSPDDDLLDAWGSIRWTLFKMLDSIKEKGEAKARHHAGVIAQEVVATFKARGLDAFKYGFICENEVKPRGDAPKPKKPKKPKTLLSIRYEQMLVLEAAWSRREHQRMDKRLAALEARLSA